MNTLPVLCARAILLDKPQDWGMGTVSVAKARELTQLAGRIGSWVTLGDSGEDYIPFTPHEQE